MNIRFHRLAVAEIDHEVDYYESRQTGLSEELEDEDEVLSMIHRFPKWLRNGNTSAIGVSPCSTASRFTLPYQIVGGDIVIVALVHTSRRPSCCGRRHQAGTEREQLGVANPSSIS
jgi:hypothetical protein